MHGVAGPWQGGYVPPLPFKHYAAHCPRILRARYKVTSWLVYKAGLRRRDDLTFWVDEAALARWQALRQSTLGEQPRCSDLAVELALTLRLVFHRALRQAEGFIRSGRAVAGRQPHGRAGAGPMHLGLDSTGLELSGLGEWCAAKHGRLRRRWLKLHLGVDASTGEIAAHVLTDDGDDAGQAPDLLRQCEGTLASVTAGGAYVRPIRPFVQHSRPMPNEPPSLWGRSRR